MPVFGKKKSQIPPVEDMSKNYSGGGSNLPPGSRGPANPFARPNSTPSPNYGPAASGGYNRYASDSSSYAPRATTAPSGYSGYSGYGRNNQAQSDALRAELFKDAPPPKASFGNQDLDKPYDQYGDPNGNGQVQDEEQEVEAIKQQIRYTKNESLQSTRNALRVAREAEETGRATLMRLGDQTEKLADTERALDMAKSYNERAADEANEIKVLNRSIFRPTFTLNKQAKRDAAERKIVDRHLEEREEREEVRRQVNDSRDRIGGTFRDLDGSSFRDSESRKGKGGGAPGAGSRFVERSRYQFEADEEDDAIENELDDNLNELGDLSKRLNLLAKAAGDEIGQQNERIDKLSGKTDTLDMKIFQNSQRLARIK